MGQNWCAKPVSVFGVVQWLGRYRWGLFWLGLSPLLKNTVAHSTIQTNYIGTKKSLAWVL